MKIHFRKEGWVYLPVSLTAWLIAILYITFSIITLIAIDRNYNSLTKSLIRFFPYFVSFSVIYFWIAANTSGGDPDK